MTAKKLANITPERQAPDGITIAASGLRSANLDRDVRAASLGPVHIGTRVQDMLERISSAMHDRSRTRAWSLTGPYGSGKSTLALITASLLGRDRGRRAEADALLGDASPALARHFIGARNEIAPEGFVICIATARREPLLATVTRAILDCAATIWDAEPMPATVQKAVERLLAPERGNGDVIAAVRALCDVAPVLLVIDEFGKSLEHLAATGDFTSDDVFLLQELAEFGAGVRGMRLFLLTLQHLSFGDYASRTTALQTREWAKIQGRFEDVLMTTHLGDAVELIRQTLNQEQVNAKGRKLIAGHATASAKAWADRGLNGVLPADADLFADLYPLHPLTTVVAPLIAAQIGQHDRSMTGFIANDEPHTVRRFLASHAVADAKKASTVRLSDIFDFFFTAGRTTILASSNASRWMEIDKRISDANGLPEHDQAILKTIGLLNLVDTSGALRASMDTILFALSDPLTIDDEDIRHVHVDRVEDLIRRGFLVYREFSDEYRVWQGSDVALSGHIGDLIDDCSDHAAVAVVSNYLPTAVVAGKHSQRTGMLRHFITKATDAESSTLTGPAKNDAADGLLMFHFGDVDSIPAVRTDKPVIVGVTSHAGNVLGAAKYLHALQELPDRVELDAVANIEVSERIAQATAELAARVAEAFAPAQIHARWFHLHNNAGTAIWSTDTATHIRGRSLAALVSAACETVFPHAPHIRNEMLGRHTLTSQGAKARRELMTAMINAPSKQYLGIDGYGPDRAMYSGVLEFLGLHRPVAHDHSEDDELVPFGYVEPEESSPLYPAWVAMRDHLQAATDKPVSLDRVFALLEAPPFGVRPGVIPIIVLTALIIGSQEYAVYEDGTYQTTISEALVERILKNPERFAVKAMAAKSGPRQQTVYAIAQEFGIRVPTIAPTKTRNVAPLAITRDLLDRVRTLSPYATRTQELSKAAKSVRHALATAREPDTLLFTELPVALGIDPIPVSGRINVEDVRNYAQGLQSALEEISSADNNLRDHVVAALADAFYLPADLPALRKRLAALTRQLATVNLVEAKVAGIIKLTQDEHLTDDEWLDPIVVRIGNRGLNEWRDGDLNVFAAEAKAVARAIQRLAQLHQTAEANAGGHAVSSRVITLTRPDGVEEHTVVQISDTDEATARQVVKATIERAREKLGPYGDRVLLALLAETVITERDAIPSKLRTREKTT